jgi:transketolase
MQSNLAEIARKSRIRALEMTHEARAAHIGSSLSVIDIAVALFAHSLRKSNSGDVVLVSKGHAAAGVYAVLNQFNVIPDSWIDDYCKNGSRLGGHVTSTNVPVLELSTGSLGHGLPFGVGRALAKKRKAEIGQVFVILSDGECDEGSNWEAALLAGHLELGQLIVFIDRNRLQSLDETEKTIALEPLGDKWRAFNWDVNEIDGHNLEQLTEAVNGQGSNKPRLFICNTIKGKGVYFMENSVKWHYRPPGDDDLFAAKELLK